MLYAWTQTIRPTAYTRTTSCLPPASYQPWAGRRKAKRKIRGTRKTTFGWAQGQGQYCHWGAALSRGMFVESAGPKSPRKQTWLVPLLREQLVCLCNYCTCIHPASHAAAGLRVTLFFSTRAGALRDLNVLTKPSQTSKWLKTFWIRDLIVQTVCKILQKAAACMKDAKTFHPRLCFNIPCIAPVPPSVNCRVYFPTTSQYSEHYGIKISRNPKSRMSFK